MSNPNMSAIDALIARAADDADLRARLLDDPRGTIQAETGMDVPAEWAIVASENAGSVELAFANGELPEEYLEMVSGGSSCNENDDGQTVVNGQATGR